MELINGCVFFLFRNIALEVLKNEPIGSFIVRNSSSKSGCFALSLKVPKEFHTTGIAHYLILRSAKGYKIKVKNKFMPLWSEHAIVWFL